MAKAIFHKANTRGHADHGWLNSYHTFSFANYQNPERVHFGALRVLNDDSVQGGMGFGAHPHDNMEIISIPLEGELEHKDSMGNKGVIKPGEIQVMSAGTGITHSEYNKNKDVPVKFLQIWIFPNKRNVTPRYDQISLNENDRQNRLQEIVSPEAGQGKVSIQQNAWFHLGKFDKGFETKYQFKKDGDGVYIFVLNGTIKVEDQQLNTRDGYGIWDTDSIKISAETPAEVLIIEVPMQI